MGIKGKTISLKKWIDDYGVEALSQKLKVDRSAVFHWRKGYCLPRGATLLKIIEMSDNALTLSSITQHFYSAENKKNRYSYKR